MLRAPHAPMDDALTAHGAATLGALGAVLLLAGRSRLQLLVGFAAHRARAGRALRSRTGEPRRRTRRRRHRRRRAWPGRSSSPRWQRSSFVRPAARPAARPRSPRRSAFRSTSTAIIASSSPSPRAASSDACCRSTSCITAAVLAAVARLVAGRRRPRRSRPRSRGPRRRSSPSRRSRSSGRRARRRGTNLLLFFLNPFVVLLAVAGRAPFPAWMPRALAAIAVALGCLFAAVGLWQAATERLLFFAPKLEVANNYGVVLPRHVALPRSEPLRTPPRRGDRRRCSWRCGFGASTCARGGGPDRVPLGRAVLLVLAVEHARAVRRRARHHRRGGRPARRGSRCSRSSSSCSRPSVPSSSRAAGRIRAARDERPLAARRGDARGRPRPPARRGGARRAAGREPGALGARRAGRELRLAHDAADRRGRARRCRAGPLPRAARRRGPHALAALATRQRRSALALGAVLLALAVHSLFYSGFFEDPITWVALAIAAAALSPRRLQRRAREPAPLPESLVAAR